MGRPVSLITKTNEAKLTIESISGPVRTVDPGILDSTATATSGPLANNASRNIASASSEAAGEPLLEVNTRNSLSESMILSFKS